MISDTLPPLLLRAAGVAILVMGTLRTEIASALHASQRHKGVSLRAAGVAISVKDTFIL